MINFKKIMFLIIGVFILFHFTFMYLARDVQEYMFVSTNLSKVDPFNEKSKSLELFNMEKNKVKGINYINGNMYPNLKKGSYYLKVKLGKGEETFLIKKDQKYFNEKIKVKNIMGINKKIIFINIFTGIIFLYNGFIFYFYRDIFNKNKELLLPLLLLLFKIIFTNSATFTERCMMEINLTFSILLNFYLIFYVLNIVKINRSKKFKKIIYTLVAIYILNSIIFFSISCSNNIFIYFYEKTTFYKSIFLVLYKWIDGPVLILSILLIQSLNEKVKKNLKKIKKRKQIVILSLLIFSLIIQNYAYNHQVYFYLNLFEEMFLFWFIILTEVENSKNIQNIFLRVSLLLIFSFVFLLYTKDILSILIFWGIFIIMNIYTYLFEGILSIEKKSFESLINRFYLIETKEDFEEQLSKEIEKNIDVKRLKVKLLIKKDEYKTLIKEKIYLEDKIIIKKDDILGDYSGGIRLSYNKNRFLGLILIKNNRDSLIYEEEKYLLELAKTISVIASKIRMNYLQKELDKCIK
ncbi:hypothetical protein [uncultured Cetobacterium sp.]|uniref:hypothetical protein n=1 Tax=uncultured Cetobacterium sp. TaxID=527638 RepID=UPI00261DC3F8|nr:hypothetical protein [uncultured Cetobacterium sp.]